MAGSVNASTRNCGAGCFGSPIDSAMCGALLRPTTPFQRVHPLERVGLQAIEAWVHRLLH
jgi:hypothetical protein